MLTNQYLHCCGWQGSCLCSVINKCFSSIPVILKFLGLQCHVTVFFKYQSAHINMIFMLCLLYTMVCLQLTFVQTVVHIKDLPMCTVDATEFILVCFSTELCQLLVKQILRNFEKSSIPWHVVFSVQKLKHLYNAFIYKA
jgi:hypothetical protein